MVQRNMATTLSRSYVDAIPTVGVHDQDSFTRARRRFGRRRSSSPSYANSSIESFTRRLVVYNGPSSVPELRRGLRQAPRLPVLGPLHGDGAPGRLLGLLNGRGCCSYWYLRFLLLLLLCHSCCATGDGDKGLHPVRFEFPRPTQCAAGITSAEAFIQRSLSPEPQRLPEHRFQDVVQFSWSLLSVPTALSTLSYMLHFLGGFSSVMGRSQ